MCALVNFEVLRASEYFAAAAERTREGFLAGVHADVVHELVFGFEGLAFAAAVLPVARVGAGLGTADVLHCQMGDDVVHGVEGSVAHLLRLGVDPAAGVLLLDGWCAQVSQEGARRVRVG